MAAKIEELRATAEVYTGDEICQEKTQFLLNEVGLPNGLLPLKDIIECGHVVETGFVWLKQKKSIEHTFEQIGKKVSYAPVVTAFAEKGRIKKLTGVKVKELLLWIGISEIFMDDPPTGKITFRSLPGPCRSFPFSSFVTPEKDKCEKEEAVAEPTAAPVDLALPVTAVEQAPHAPAADK